MFLYSGVEPDSCDPPSAVAHFAMRMEKRSEKLCFPHLNTNLFKPSYIHVVAQHEIDKRRTTGSSLVLNSNSARSDLAEGCAEEEEGKLHCKCVCIMFVYVGKHIQHPTKGGLTQQCVRTFYSVYNSNTVHLL